MLVDFKIKHKKGYLVLLFIEKFFINKWKIIKLICFSKNPLWLNFLVSLMSDLVIVRFF